MEDRAAGISRSARLPSNAHEPERCGALQRCVRCSASIAGRPALRVTRHRAFARRSCTKPNRLPKGGGGWLCRAMSKRPSASVLAALAIIRAGLAELQAAFGAFAPAFRAFAPSLPAPGRSPLGAANRDTLRWSPNQAYPIKPACGGSNREFRTMPDFRQGNPRYFSTGSMVTTSGNFWVRAADVVCSCLSSATSRG